MVIEKKEKEMVIEKDEILEMALDKKWEIVEFAIENHNDGYGKTVVFMDIENGEITGHIGNNSYPIWHQEYENRMCPIFEIKGNTMGNFDLDDDIPSYFPEDIREQFDLWVEKNENEERWLCDFCDEIKIDYEHYFFLCWKGQFEVNPEYLEAQIEEKLEKFLEDLEYNEMKKE